MQTKLLLIIITFFLIYNDCKAQFFEANNYCIKDLPQSNNLNPSFVSRYKFYVQFPALDINLNYRGLSFYDVYNSENQDGDLYINLNKLNDKLYDNKLLSFQLNLGLIAFGYRYKNNYFNFRITEKNDFRYIFNNHLIEFAAKGNVAFLTKEMNLSPKIKFTNYTELGFNWVRKKSKYLYYGITGKLLFGKAYADSNDYDLTLKSNSHADYFQAKGSGKMYVYLPNLDVVNDTIRTADDIKLYNLEQKHILNFANKGFAVDVGVRYKYRNNITFSSSLIDFGFINLNNGYELSKSYEQRVDMLDLSHSINDHDPNYKDVKDVYKETIEDIKNKIDTSKFVVSKKKSFVSFLTPKIYAGVEYKYNKNLKFNGLLMTELYDYDLYAGISLAAQYNTKYFNIIANTMYSSNTLDAGVGFNVKLGFFQLFMASDNILSGLKLLNARNLNFRFGLNIVPIKFKEKYTVENFCEKYLKQRLDEEF